MISMDSMGFFILPPSFFSNEAIMAIGQLRKPRAMLENVVKFHFFFMVKYARVTVRRSYKSKNKNKNLPLFIYFKFTTSIIISSQCPHDTV